MSLHHTQGKGLRISNSLDLGYRYHPRYRYAMNGGGRDTYIGINSGGLKSETKIPKGTSIGP